MSHLPNITHTHFMRPESTLPQAQSNALSVAPLRIVNLFPQQMNIYGDTGNLLVLQRRCQWRGLPVEVVSFNPGSSAELLETADILLGGGGQDSGQAVVQSELVRIAPVLHALIASGAPALVVCGTYQLFGSYFKTVEGEVIEGIGIFDAYTLGGPKRMIGNIITHNSTFGELVGYENHSGCTHLGTQQTPLATVVSGCGNNGEDGTEGARTVNALGTYLHGPLLPKNPQLADFLLATALERRFGSEPLLAPLPDKWVAPARAVAQSRPR